MTSLEKEYKAYVRRCRGTGVIPVYISDFYHNPKFHEKERQLEANGEHPNGKRYKSTGY